MIRGLIAWVKWERPHRVYAPKLNCLRQICFAFLVQFVTERRSATVRLPVLKGIIYLVVQCQEIIVQEYRIASDYSVLTKSHVSVGV